MKTNALRKIIQSNIQSVVTSYYRTADPGALYPHAVYDFENIDLGDIWRDDSILIIDIWDKGNDTARIEDITDSIEAMFNAANLPNDEVLPTFYRIGRKPIDDEDKTIMHRQLKFQVQNYDIGG
ncbi:MAG: hypothetical protein ABS949_14760 [Solibacillus sp.]